MRILCGCIGATTGHARIGGVDVLQRPNEVKRRIGYLPEVPPLYGTMVVEDYVTFAASIKGVAQPLAAAERALERAIGARRPARRGGGWGRRERAD